jgi:hypothetical protein
MKTIKFENETRILTLTKVVESSNHTHFFTIEIDGDIDTVAFNANTDKNKIKNWLQDNCDVEGTTENIELFLTFLN